MTLPADSDERKGIPLYSGCFQYFPAALAGVARWSKLGNDKHNPGQPLHHSRGKSADHADCVLRHLMDLGEIEAQLKRLDGKGSGSPKLIAQLLDEADALVWRAMALNQELREHYTGAPLAPGAKLPEPVTAVSIHPSNLPFNEHEGYGPCSRTVGAIAPNGECPACDMNIYKTGRFCPCGVPRGHKHASWCMPYDKRTASDRKAQLAKRPR